MLACSITDWIQSAAFVAATCVAARGLQTWREQLRGNVRHDAALNLLERAYGLRDALQAMRRTCTFAGPFVGCEPSDAREAAQALDQAAREPRTALDIARVRAEAVFGVDQVSALVRPIHKAFGTIVVGVEHEILCRAEGDDALKPPREKGICWVSDDPNRDAVTALILDALRPVEDWARAELR